MSEVSGSIPVSGLCFLLIFVVFTLCLPCYSTLLSTCTVKLGAPSKCKGSTLSRHFRGLGFDSCVRTRFPIDLCCIYLVFTLLFILVKRMYSKAWCSVHGVKIARSPGMSEVSGSIFRVRTLFSIDLCSIYLVFTMLFIFVKRMYS